LTYGAVSYHGTFGLLLQNFIFFQQIKPHNCPLCSYPKNQCYL